MRIAIRAVSIRTVSMAMLAVLLYVVAGEVLQSWAGLHFDAWRERKAFGNERDLVEWQRVGRGLDFAQQAWPWKASFYRDVARLQLFGAYGGFVGEADAGAAMLDAVDQAAARRIADGELLVLEARGCLMVGDYTGAADAIDRLKRTAPNARYYWKQLARQLRVRASEDSALEPLAREVIAQAARWR